MLCGRPIASLHQVYTNSTPILNQLYGNKEVLSWCI